MQSNELLQDFIDEAKSHIEYVEDIFLQTETIYKNNNWINDVFRAIHSIKGTAGFFSLKKIVELSHNLENALGFIREKHIDLSENLLDELLQCVDKLKILIINAKDSNEMDINEEMLLLNNILLNLKSTTHEIEEKNKTHLQKNKKTENFDIDEKYFEKIQTLIKHGHKIFLLKIDANQFDLETMKILIKNIKAVGEIIYCLSASKYFDNYKDILEIVKNADKIEFLTTSVIEIDLYCETLEIKKDWVREIDFKSINKKENEETDLKEKQELSEDTIRVNVALLERLMQLSGEMVLARNQLLMAYQSENSEISMQKIVQNINLLTSTLQTQIIKTKMQPIANVFNKFPRLVRDISKNLNKNIDLVLEGKEIEIDKTTIENISDPLIHLVRNAIDHGIESQDERIRLQKSEKGIIILKAYYKGNLLVIDVIDDGKGLDRKKIEASLVKKQIYSKKEVENMSDEEIYKSIFLPGISTSKEISDISGRGVGMDVVQTNVNKLSGNVSVLSVKGIGTTIRLSLPKTVSILQSLVVECDGQKYSIPQSYVNQIMEITNKSKIITSNTKKSRQVNFRGKIIPVISLREIFEVENKNSETSKIIILNVMKSQIGLLVDNVVDTQENLINPLPVFIKSSNIYSAVTIMGDGKISLVLNLESIVEKSKIKLTKLEDNKNLHSNNLEQKTASKKQSMILFKCSGDETYAVDMSVVARVENIKKSDIEIIGEKTYVKLHDRLIRLIIPEDYIQTQSRGYKQENLAIILPLFTSIPIGILVNKVYDTIQNNVEIAPQKYKIKGISGTSIYNNKAVIVLNLMELLEMVGTEEYLEVSIEQENLNKKILIVEDDNFFEYAQSNHFEKMGCEVTVVKNAEEGLSYLNKYQFDLIICDLIMSKVSGLDFIKQVRKNNRTKSIPAIAVTTITSKEYIQKAINCGFDAYEHKLNKQNLIKTVRELLKSKG